MCPLPKWPPLPRLAKRDVGVNVLNLPESAAGMAITVDCHVILFKHSCPSHNDAVCLDL